MLTARVRGGLKLSVAAQVRIKKLHPFGTLQTTRRNNSLSFTPASAKAHGQAADNSSEHIHNGIHMNHDKKLPDGNQTAPPTESPEERARRVADIKRRVAQGKYLVNGREILYNMLKTAP
jgi:hypothetical protein